MCSFQVAMSHIVRAPRTFYVPWTITFSCWGNQLPDCLRLQNGSSLGQGQNFYLCIFRPSRVCGPHTGGLKWMNVIQEDKQVQGQAAISLGWKLRVKISHHPPGLLNSLCKSSDSPFRLREEVSSGDLNTEKQGTEMKDPGKPQRRNTRDVPWRQATDTALGVHCPGAT